MATVGRAALLAFLALAGGAPPASAQFQRGTAEFGQRSNQGHAVFVKATTVF